MKRRLLLWHYTTGTRFREIVETGEIRAATTFVDPRERPIVWFSSNQDWEPTAWKLFIQPNGQTKDLRTPQEIAELFGLVRIGVDRATAPHDWPTLRRRSRMDGDIARALEKAGREVGSNPAWWYGSFDPVPRSKWRTVQSFESGTWTELSLESAPMSEEGASP